MQKLHASVLLSHLYAFLLFLGHCWAGYVPLHAVLLYGLWIGAGWPLSPGPTPAAGARPRVTLACSSGTSEVAVTGVLLFVAAPQAAFQALVMLLVFSTDGFSAPRRTSFWMTWSCTLIAIALP